MGRFHRDAVHVKITKTRTRSQSCNVRQHCGITGERMPPKKDIGSPTAVCGGAIFACDPRFVCEMPHAVILGRHTPPDHMQAYNSGL